MTPDKKAGADPLAQATVVIPGRDGRNGGWPDFELTPGLIDDNARNAFNGGHCLGLAQAVRRETGWPLVWIGLPECAYDEDCLDEPELECGAACCQVAHVAVLAPDGRVVDINGAETVTEAIKEIGYLAESDPQEMWEQSHGPVTDYDADAMLGHWSWIETPAEVADSFVGAVLAQAGYGKNGSG